MWDPRTYEDTDYGLDDGETFEPAFDFDDEPFDSSLPHIMTVLGPIEPEELGVCIPATRFLPLLNPSQHERAHARALAEAAEELEAFASVGGRSVVDIATAQTGRDIATVQRLTQLAPSHLIVAAGLPASDVDPVAHLREECAGGIDGTEVSAGLVVLDASTVDDTLLTAGTSVAREHGMPTLLSMRTWSDASAFRVAEGITTTEAAPALIFAGPSGLPDDATIALAHKLGAFIAIEVPTDISLPAERALAERLVALIQAGYGDSLLVTINLVSKRLPVVAPMEPRSPYLIDRLAIALMETGASAYDVRQVMIENPARALTIIPRVS